MNIGLTTRLTSNWYDTPRAAKRPGRRPWTWSTAARQGLIQKQTPINVGATNLQTKDFYYDGVRRIQEHITRPREKLLEHDPGTLTTSGPAENDELALTRTDGEKPGQEIVPTAGVEIVPDPTPTPQVDAWVDRAYIYGPDYVDEFVAQIDRWGNVVLMLQDANYNVVALVSGGWPGTVPEGGGPTIPFAPAGTLLEQYTYDPYGAILFGENFDLRADGTSGHAVNRVGHQGLFFERFDGSYTDPTLAEGGLPELTSTLKATGLYYNRNRFYHPHLGRFLTRDPNETALPILTALASNGEATHVGFG